MRVWQYNPSAGPGLCYAVVWQEFSAPTSYSACSISLERHASHPRKISLCSRSLFMIVGLLGERASQSYYRVLWIRRNLVVLQRHPLAESPGSFMTFAEPASSFRRVPPLCFRGIFFLRYKTRTNYIACSFVGGELCNIRVRKPLVLLQSLHCLPCAALHFVKEKCVQPSCYLDKRLH